jgi:hypothetical protein
LQRLKECDLVIALIDKRYGGIYEETNGTPISITRKELRVAQSNDIPVWTFVRTQTWDERKRFKDFIKKRKVNLKKNITTVRLFDEFKKSFDAYVDSPYVFDLIDEITRFKKSNWIFNQFRTSHDLLTTVGQQFVSYLSEHYSNNLLLIGTDNVFDVPDFLKEFFKRSGKYDKDNLLSLSIGMRLMRDAVYQPRAFIELQDISDRIYDTFIKDFTVRAEDVVVDRNSSRRVFVTDTTMETMNPDAWRKSAYHRRIIEASERLARKHNLRYVKYQRVIILFDPNKALLDDEWVKSLDFLIKFHRRLKIKLGLCCRIVLPLEFDDRLLNFYLIPNELIAVWDPTQVMAFEFSRRNNAGIVRNFTELYEMIVDSCDRKHGGFWIKEKMNVNDVIKELSIVMTTQGS